jgi:hypothetical protein
MVQWADCYTIDGPHAGRVYQYGIENRHLLIGGFIDAYYLITDELIELPTGQVPVARYFGETAPSGAEPVPGKIPPDYYTEPEPIE